MALELIPAVEDNAVMTAQTEAACLLQSGALYARRVLLQTSSDGPIFAGFKAGAFSLYFGDAPIYHFDLEGRWQRAYADGLHYLKGLDGAVQTIDRVREGKNLVLKRRTLSDPEAAGFDARVRSEALAPLQVLAENRTEPLSPPSPAQVVSDDALATFLEKIATWDAAAWFAHRERYLETYGPLPFLPPDCPHAVTVQATLGHAGGRTFGLGPAHEHYVRSVSEFEDHARAVVKLFGRRLEQCKNVFLAGSDVLLLPERDVTGYLETIRQVLSNDGPKGSPEGVHAFLDDAPADRPSAALWARYAEGGLQRVTFGVESGVGEIRALYGKAWSNDDLRGLVATIKSAGIGVGVMALVGAGGVVHGEHHRDATVELLESLDLGPGDIVSLVDARELAHDGATAWWRPLDDFEYETQLSEFRSGLVRLRSGRGVKVVPYSFEKQG